MYINKFIYLTSPCEGGLEYRHRSPARRRRRRKDNPAPGGYNWATLSLGDINKRTWSLGSRLTTLLCKKIIVAKSKEVKTGYNLAGSCKEAYGPKRDVFPMMMMIYLTNLRLFLCLFNHHAMKTCGEVELYPNFYMFGFRRR
jgi:hypothetical protein